MQAHLRHEADTQARRTQQESLTQERIVAYDGPVPSFLDEEYQYMKEASINFPEMVTAIRWGWTGCLNAGQLAVDLFRLCCHFCNLSFETINLLRNRFGQGFNLVLMRLGQGHDLVLVCLLLIFHSFHERLDKIRQSFDLSIGVPSLLLRRGVGGCRHRTLCLRGKRSNLSRNNTILEVRADLHTFRLRGQGLPR